MSSISDGDPKFVYELRLRKLSNAIHSATDIDEVLIGLRSEILKLYDADLVTIYVVDNIRSEVYSKVKKKEAEVEEIRLPINTKSIAGYVAFSGNSVNIKDVRDKNELMRIDVELKFDASWDEKASYRTKQVLALPIKFNHKILGVIQLVNKKNGDRFTYDDQKPLSDVAEILGISFYNHNRIRPKPKTKYHGLLLNHIVSKADLKNALTIAQNENKDIFDVLMSNFGVKKTAIGQSLSAYYNLRFDELKDPLYDPSDLLANISLEFLIRNYWVPLMKKENKIIVAMENPNDTNLISDIQKAYSPKKIECRVALRKDILSFIGTFKSGTGNFAKKSINELIDIINKEKIRPNKETFEPVEADPNNENAIVNLVHKIITDAIDMGASDIHIESYGNLREADIRYRIDGVCEKVLSIPPHRIREIVSRIKIVSNLDFSEKRFPQDGKIMFDADKGKKVEVRIVTLPTVSDESGNEDVILRLLRANKSMPLMKIMDENTYQIFRQLLQKPYGLVLVVGPTGSGKTTTLHAGLQEINTPEKKILTAEDPVEITQYRLRQVEIKPKIGFGFANALRAFLRADPDVIMVGEMRDVETASVAIEASLTGHLVLSTLHTNTAPETIIRLTDMGMDPFNFSDALLGILAQRLLRTLCKRCKKSYHPSQEEYNHLKSLHGDSFYRHVNKPYLNDLHLFKISGCKACRNSGYQGRMGIHELLVASPAIKQMIFNRLSAEEIRKKGITEGMTTLMQDGIYNIFNGLTDVNQVISVCAQ